MKAHTYHCKEPSLTNMVSENVQSSHAASCLTSFSKSRSYLVESILEQYYQLFSEYSESLDLFANLAQRTNNSNLSA